MEGWHLYKMLLTALPHNNNEGMQRVWKEQWNRNTTCNKSCCDHRVFKVGQHSSITSQLCYV